MSIEALLPELLATAEQLKTAGAANEANTKHHVIEPLLAGRGWNTGMAGLGRPFAPCRFPQHSVEPNGGPSEAAGERLANLQEGSNPITDSGAERPSTSRSSL